MTGSYPDIKTCTVRFRLSLTLWHNAAVHRRVLQRVVMTHKRKASTGRLQNGQPNTANFTARSNPKGECGVFLGSLTSVSQPVLHLWQ
jgi:hypothetical protein